MIFASSLARSSHDGGSVPARSSAPAHSSTVADGFTPSNVGARFLFWPETPARSSTRVCTSTLARTLGLRPHAHDSPTLARSSSLHGLQPVRSSTPVRSSMLAHKGI